jgi:hypothetical protein
MSLVDLMADWLSQSVTIERGTPATAPSGQANKKFAAIASDVACQIQIQRGQFFRAEWGDSPAAIALGFFEVGTDVREGDRVRDVGQVWLVDVVNAPRDAEADHLEATMHLVSGVNP